MPLAGIRVIEYAVFHAGPGAASILGELGADVIKIESGAGDPSRTWSSAGNMDFSLTNDQTVTYQISNRNKRGIYVQMGSTEGKKIFHRLLGGADVFITNLRKSSRQERGMDYAAISKINPRIVYASVSGYGPEGPDSDLGAYDPLGQARCGLMYATGFDEPAVLNLAFLDQATAVAASHAILTALLVQQRQGIGQEVHVSLYSAGLWLMYPNMFIVGAFSKDPNVAWNRHENSPLRNRFRCKDGVWIMSAHHPEEKYWSVFCEATGQKQLLDDSRFLDDASRRANCRALVAIFDDVFACKTSDEWMRILLSAGLMVSPVRRNLNVVEDLQALANDYMVDFEHPVLGKIKIPGYPIHFSENSAVTRTIGFEIGAHTDQILEEIGYSSGEIGTLRAQGIVR